MSGSNRKKTRPSLSLSLGVSLEQKDEEPVGIGGIAGGGGGGGGGSGSHSGGGSAGSHSDKVVASGSDPAAVTGRKSVSSSSISTVGSTPTPALPLTPSTAHGDLESLREKLKTLMGAERDNLELFIFNKQRVAGKLSHEALTRLQLIYSGDGREVHLVRHNETQLVMAQKIVPYDPRPEQHEQLEQELALLHECHCPQVVGFYGTYLGKDNHEVNILIEYMDGGCLEDVLLRVGRMPEEALLIVAKHVLLGLQYLQKNNIIHRDVKPSNILVNTKGEVKLCDFGISRKLRSSNATTFVGTLRYMSPERLRGKEYTVLSDVWSLGVALIEMATGLYPFLNPKKELAPVKKPRKPVPGAPIGRRAKEGGSKTMPFFEMFEMVVKGEPPQLPPSPEFSALFSDFVKNCVGAEPDERLSLDSLLDHPWIKQYDAVTKAFDFASWVKKTYPPGAQYTNPP